MNKRRLILFTCAALLFTTVAFAQQGLNDSNATADSALDNSISMLDTPVAGIGYALTNSYVSLMATIASATNGIGSSVTSSFRGLANALVSVYFLLMGTLIMWGYMPNPKREGVTLLLVVIVTNIVFNPGTYQEWVAGPILDTVKSLGDFLVSKSTGGQSGSMFQILGDGMDKIMAVCVKMDQAADIWTPKLLISAVIAELALTLTYLAVLLVFIIINVLMWFGIYLLNVFGAVCLYFVIFPATRHIFFAWLRAIINYCLVIVFASLIMGVCLKVMSPRLDALAVLDFGTVNPLFNAATYTCIAINVLCWCMLLKAPDFAAALSGGSAGNTAGIAGVVSMAGGAAYGGAKRMAVNRFRNAMSADWSPSPGGGTMGAMARTAGRTVGGLRSASASRGIEY
jgi:Type IV secretory pathway, VirB6 components